MEEIFGMQKNKTPCQYAIVRFAPFVETGEFANIGVVLFAPKVGYFDFKLENKKYSRVTNFFNEIEGGDYKEIVNNFNLELQRICNMVRMDPSEQEVNETIFKDVVKNREGMIQFSKPRILLAADPKEQVQKIFNYYVERNFVSNEHRETILEARVKKWFRDVSISQTFKRERIGDDIYHATFPFVSMADNKPVKIIKPFFLGQKEPSQIIDHSLAWKGKLERLHSRLPDKILFTVEGPQTDALNKDDNRNEAYEQAVDILERTQIVTIEKGFHKNTVIDFAMSS